MSGKSIAIDCRPITIKELQVSEPAVKSALTSGIGFLAAEPIGLKSSDAVVFINPPLKNKNIYQVEESKLDTEGLT